MQFDSQNPSNHPFLSSRGLSTFIALIRHFRSLIVCILILMGLGGGISPVSAKVSRITVNGITMDVRWSDGDSFRITSGKHRGNRARLMGYNTLESYGPVHKWGDWSPWELYKVAKDSKQVAESQVWECVAQEERDRYKRMLVRCPDLIKAMISSGYGHLFEIGQDPHFEDVKLQKKAMVSKKGMWKKGAPPVVLTSVHSIDEGSNPTTYNRFVKTTTGRAEKFHHTNQVKSCQWVCHQGACMLYVPFKNRYGDRRPDCLKWNPTP